MTETLSSKIEDWRIITNNHVRNISDVTKAHMIDMINNVEDETKEFIKQLKIELVCPHCNFAGFHNKTTEIDKLAGEDLIK